MEGKQESQLVQCTCYCSILNDLGGFITNNVTVAFEILNYLKTKHNGKKRLHGG